MVKLSCKLGFICKTQHLRWTTGRQAGLCAAVTLETYSEELSVFTETSKIFVSTLSLHRIYSSHSLFFPPPFSHFPTPSFTIFLYPPFPLFIHSLS